MTTPDTGPAWARDYDVAMLKDAARVHRRYDKPYALGAFSNVNERAIAEWLEAAEYIASGYGDAAARVRFPRVRTAVHDFTGEVRATIPAGAMVMSHPASDTQAGWDYLAEGLQRRWPLTEHAASVWLEGWREAPEVVRLAEDAGLRLVATKIKASSELVGVWTSSGWVEAGHVGHELSPADERTLVRLERSPDIAELAARAAAEVADTAGWADHYSSYNARHAWSALALQGYTDPATGPDAAQIIKPAEMSKAWKAEHPGWGMWRLEPTPLVQALPATAALVAALAWWLGANFQRVRLMRLEPGGGELTRHSDITDPEAGTAERKLARLHVPLITNPDVRFRQWRLDGRQVEANMAAGELWYLDTRKPHRAGNYGTEPRVHLVLDAYVSATVRDLITRGEEAAVAP